MTTPAPSLLEVEPCLEPIGPKSARREVGGAPESFDEVFRAHSTMVFRILRAMGVPEAGLDEATQDVFLTVHHKLAEFAGRSQLSTWICGITYGVGRNARRKAYRGPTFVEITDDVSVSHRTPEQAVTAQQTVDLVTKFCEDLTDGMRDVFVFVLLEERPAAEVAQLLELSENTVSSRVRLLRTKLRAYLKDVHEKGNNS